jgi:hypothetical protein
MRRNKRVLGAAIGVGALVFAGAAAFTNTISFTNTNTTLGYGSENVSGATVTTITYGLSTDGTTIDSVTFVASGNTSGSTADVGFTTGSGNQATTPCDPGTFASGNTTYLCDDNDAGLSQSTAGVLATDIVVQ